MAATVADPETGKNTSPKFDLGRNLCNKLWNAARLVISIFDKHRDEDTLADGVRCAGRDQDPVAGPHVDSVHPRQHPVRILGVDATGSAGIAAAYDVGIPKPRDRGDPRITALREQLLDELGVPRRSGASLGAAIDEEVTA